MSFFVLTAFFVPLSSRAQNAAPSIVAMAARAERLPDAPQPQFDLASNEQAGSQSGTARRQAGNAQPPRSAPNPGAGIVSGTVIDVNDDIVLGATLTLDDAAHTEHRTVNADDNGAFEFKDLKPNTPYTITIRAKGFTSWTSPEIRLTPGQYYLLTDIHLRIAGEQTTITVYSSNEQLATEQIHMEEKQRVLGIIPNFYVVYDADAVPLTTKLKYKLALRTSTDPITFLGAAFLAGIYQGVDIPDYVQGAKGYGQRLGANYADTVTDIMFGGAILPSLLHQDPRYFYQGTGTIKSRARHAVFSPFVCRGDNGKPQPNYSSIGGDLASAAISNAYYPSSNRGAGLMFENTLISTGERVASSLLQEFVLRKFIPSAKKQD